MKIRKVRGANRSEYTIKKKKKVGISLKKKEPLIEVKRKENRYNLTKNKDKKEPIKNSKRTTLKKKNAIKKSSRKFVFKGPNKYVKITVIFILAIIYIPTMIVWITGKDLKIDYLKNGTLKEIIDVDGIFIRNEEVLVAPISGKCVTNVFLGEKVGKNQEIGRITTSSSQKTTDDLNYIDNKILKLIKSDNESTNFYSEDILKIDDDISYKLKELSLLSVKNNIESSEKIESEINELIKKKIELVSDSNIVGGQQLEALKEKKKTLMSKVSDNTIILKAKNSGLIAYFIDGYENQYSPDNMDKISVEDINSIKRITNDSFDFSSFNVQQKKPYAKLIKDFESYIVIELDNNKAKFIKENDKINITIQDINKSTEATIVKEIKEAGKTKVFLKITSLLSETCTLRKAELEIIVKPYSGYRVPVKSLLNFDKKNKTAKIMMISSNYTEIKKVKVVVCDKEYAIIDNLKDKYDKTISLYDKYVIDPKGIGEGERMKDGN